MRARARAGFTLLEVLVAVAILGLVVLGVTGLVVQGVRGLRIADERHAAMELAEQKLTELTLTSDLSPGAEEGDYGENWPDHRWQAEVAETDVPDLYRVTVTVLWDSGGVERSLELQTCLAANTVEEQPATAGEGSPSSSSSSPSPS